MKVVIADLRQITSTQTWPTGRSARTPGNLYDPLDVTDRAARLPPTRLNAYSANCMCS